MIATVRKRSQITLPAEIVNSLGISEGDQLQVFEKDGGIVLLPLAVYPVSYIEELKYELSDIKAKIESGEHPVFDNVDALFEALEKDE